MRVCDEESRTLLAAGRDLLREGIAELRSLQFELSPPALRQRGLPGALEWLASDTRSRWGIRIDCAIAAELPPLGHELSVILFRCARELVYNLIKHARATRGELRLAALDGGITLCVQDDGVGFGTRGGAEPGSPAAGFGLYSLRERIAPLGGKLIVESLAPGSRVCIRLPADLPKDFPRGRDRQRTMAE